MKIKKIFFTVTAMLAVLHCSGQLSIARPAESQKNGDWISYDPGAASYKLAVISTKNASGETFAFLFGEGLMSFKLSFPPQVLKNADIRGAELVCLVDKGPAISFSADQLQIDEEKGVIEVSGYENMLALIKECKLGNVANFSLGGGAVEAHFPLRGFTKAYAHADELVCWHMKGDD